ncbi:MAG: hypothetical protein PUE33_01905 [bacterium]|nr:hypothetical protein [Mycoplasmatota bacterium]MDD6756805.1 hypothetical protein [bacterium]MDY2908246.1 hypothetical protein [Candidatus Faecimonas sp.]
MEKQRTQVEWYDNPNIITNLIIIFIGIIIILSQSFAINNNLSTSEILRSIINHNSLYLILLVYFVALKTKVGKRYFDFLNVFLILLYFLNAITSVLTIFQSFSLDALVGCVLQLVLFIYLFHTMFRRTRIWKEFHLSKSPFNEIKNDAYFSSVFILTIILWAVDLIATTTLDGTILTCLDTAFLLLFDRYIFLYGCFLDNKEKKINTSITIEDVKEVVDEVKEKFGEVAEVASDSAMDLVSQVQKKIDDTIDNKEKEEKTKLSKDSKTKKVVKKDAKKNIKNTGKKSIDKEVQ